MNAFDAHFFMNDLTKVCDNNGLDGWYGQSVSAGRMIGFFTSALPQLNLNEEQVATLNRMLETAKSK